jgi:CheY-like chemotaxis protein
MADPFDGGAPGADGAGTSLLAAAWDALEPAFVVREGPGPGFRLVLASRAWIEAIGLPRAAIWGQPLAELLPAGPAGDLEARCRAAIASKAPLRFTWAFPKGLGVTEAEVALTPLFDGAGVCSGVLGVAREASAAKAPAAAAAPRSPQAQVPRDLHARVLIIDDEPLVGASIRRVLSGEHEVFAVTQGAEALRRIAAGERFDALLCDLMMPEMTGMDLHDELSRSCPDQAGRMGFLTGGTYTRRASAFVERMADRTLAKPFSTEALRGFVRKLSQQ